MGQHDPESTSKVEECVDNICRTAKTETDIKHYQKKFELDMKGDLENLKKELGNTKRKLVLSKEVLVAAVAFGSAFVNPFKAIEGVAGLGIVGVGALIKNIGDTKIQKRKYLSDHPMSWLYLAKKKRK